MKVTNEKRQILAFVAYVLEVLRGREEADLKKQEEERARAEKVLLERLGTYVNLYLKSVNAQSSVVNTIAINKKTFKDVLRMVVAKLEKFSSRYREGRYRKIKIFDELTEVSQGAVLAKLFHNFTSYKAGNIINIQGIEQEEGPDQQAIVWLYSAKFYIFLFFIIFEFIDIDPSVTMKQLGPMCDLVISNQSNQNNSALIFELLVHYLSKEENDG